MTHMNWKCKNSKHLQGLLLNLKHSQLAKAKEEAKDAAEEEVIVKERVELDL